MLVIVIFVTSRSYAQLGIAVVLYPLLAFFAYKLFVRDNDFPIRATRDEIDHQINARGFAANEATVAAGGYPDAIEGVGILDNNKRDFLKMVGAAGISFFIFSIFDRWSRNNYMERILDIQKSSQAINGGGTPNTEVSVKDSVENYQITQIDDNLISYYGFTKKDGAWFILREDTEDGSYRYAKGDKNFNDNWQNRNILDYDYYFNVFQ